MEKFAIWIEEQNFKIELKEPLNNEDFSRMRLLYMPIIGLIATSLYSLLYDFNNLNKNNNLSLKWKVFKKILGISFKEIELAKNKLEAVGLLKSYEKADNKNFIYSLNKPSIIEKFKKNIFLYKKAIKKIGESLFETIEFKIKNKYIKKDEYKDVTKKYQEVFEIDTFEKQKNNLEFTKFEYNSIEEAIEKINSFQFINYLSNEKPSPSQINLINKLQMQNLSPIAINHIIHYTFEVNGRIVNNYIEKIANDLLSKSIIYSTDIKEEMNRARKAKKNNLQNIEINDEDIFKTENNIKEVDKNWNEILSKLGNGL